MTIYLGVTSLGLCALSVCSGLSQLCEFDPLRLDLCSPLVRHGRARKRRKPRLNIVACTHKDLQKPRRSTLSSSLVLQSMMQPGIIRPKVISVGMWNVEQRVHPPRWLKWIGPIIIVQINLFGFTSG